MRKLLFAVLLLVPTAGLAQSCSPTSPCAQVTITNTNTLPSLTALWNCVGVTSSNCTAGQLSAAMAGQSATSLCPASTTAAMGNWKCIQFTQTTSPQNYNDPHSYGSMVNYAAQGTANGGVSGVSQITTFQLPQAPAQVPLVGSPVLVLTGTPGLQ